MYQSLNHDGECMPERPAIALGFFDGLHAGHRAILEAACAEAKQAGTGAVMMTFDPHPSAVIDPAHAVRLIYPDAVRKDLLRRRGWIDGIVTLPFDKAVMTMPAADFVVSVLHRQYHASSIIVGEDFRFGSKNAGTAKVLRELCKELGIRCRIVPQQLMQNEKVSSTRIREALSQGNLTLANELLIDPYRIMGKVSHGAGLGHRSLLPTANLPLDASFVTLPDGVYVTRTFYHGGNCCSVTNIGCNPTVSEGLERRSETFLLGTQADLYGQELTVEFLEYIRPEKKFDDLEALRAQQAQDLEKVKAYIVLQGKTNEYSV